MSKKVRVGLIYGGKSGEHDVSLQTALAVIKEFDFTKYEIIPFYITRHGEWQKGPKLNAPVANKALLAFSADADAGGSQPANSPIPLFQHITQLDPPGNRLSGDSAIDVVFPLLHGTNGEDGTIQGMLEIANIPYVGAGVLASAVGMDKVLMKKVFAQADIPQCIYRHFTRTEWEKKRDFFLMEVEISLGYPCFIKPANLGSSVGISKAKNREELIKAIAFAFQYDRKVIVEEFIDAREVEVSVLGNDEPIASVPGEIVSSNDFYDYRAKYVDGKSAMVIPADLSAETADQLRDMAIRAFQAIDGSGLSRVDFFVSKENQQILINEINTMPGFTPISMYPLLWRESGKPYGELLDDLIRLALERFEEKQKINFGFDVE
jgi:D-alanine-D-alanine ligase